MIAKFTRNLSILVALLLSLHCKTLAATVRYVNINNPTPGDGTTWAKAFNDLQTALSTATLFEDIWIAKGTYLPSLPAGRSATFSLPIYVNLYGGFNGTETAATQRDPTLNPTILSGDIGVAGNASDNCYHVVTINNTGWPTLHDLTIANGQADAGYPGSTVQQADNTGGGVLVLSASSPASSTFDLHNCILRDNFAVYGGGVGAFGYGGGIQTQQQGYGCLFYNNQAVYGGAISASNDGSNGMLIYESCIFNNNTALSGNASVFASSMANTTGTVQLCQINNCLFYNEAVPLFSVQTSNVPSYSYSLQYSIIWTAGTPYTGGYTSGNGTIPISTCDIDGSVPAGGNINADPLFVNASGGDFHVSPCSPVIDKGYPTTSSTSPTDYGGNARVQGVGIDIGPYETPLGTIATRPTATAPSPYCIGATAAVLTATGSNLLWYTAATGGTGDPTAPTPSTVSVGSTTYYVTQTPASSCESPRTAVTITINSGATAPPSEAPTTYCQNATASPLTATGANLLWYTTATGGTGDPTAPTPPTGNVGSTTYYVSQTPASSCESLRTPVNVTINPTPSADFTWSAACERQATKITAASPAASQYTWDFGTGASVTGSGAGPIEVIWANPNTYAVSLTAKEGGCQAQATHLITVNSSPKVGIVPPNGGLCVGSDIPLEAYGASTYQWSPATDLSNPGIAIPMARLQNNIEYTVTGHDDNGCSASASIALTLSSDCLAYSIPDAFTPNGDGKNDEFRVKSGDVPRSFSLLIFNRFGGKVFESTSISSGWNGTYGGNSAPTGTYVYVVQATTSAGTVVKRQGTILLIR